MLAADLIRTVERAGGHLEPDGDSLMVEAPEPLPEAIMTELRAHKTEVIDFLNRAAPLVIAPDLSDPENIRAWLLKRAAMRENSGTGKIDAVRLAFDELLWLWHAANPVTLSPGQCAACGTAFEPPVMSLPDGAQVCNKADHACLISYGNGRRTEAVNALRGLGIEPPAWWEI